MSGTPGTGPKRRPAQRGMTLVELMVALGIGLLLTLAVVSVLTLTDASRRRTQSINDINQVGAYAELALDKWLRNAGSGFAQTAAYSYGCLLNAAKAGAQILPRGSNALPAPFANVTTGSAGQFRLAPVLIAAGQTTPSGSGSTSDVLVVMSGNAGFAETPTSFASVADASALLLSSTLGFQPGDLLLIADQQASPTGMADCLVQQVSSSFSSSGSSAGAATLPLAGSYYASTLGSTALTDLSADAVALNLGNVGSGNTPSFLLLGVGDHNTLFSYDLLQTSSAPLQAVADGVFELHALYGLDSDGDGRIDSWASPASGDYAVSALSDGSAAAAGRLQTIKAIRLGLILRTTQPDSSTVAPAALSLFAELGSTLTLTRTLSSSERRYRYRTLESTIPLRNNLLLD
jgi:type IV pilus assembly protein PilW